MQSSQGHQEMMSNQRNQQPPPPQDRRLKPFAATGGDSSQAAAAAAAALQQHPPQKCPRCESMNTKFCYYNNYSLTQPRYFCKACRRYWTQGGTLRNVPVGGGCRKGKRAKITSSSHSASTTASSSLSQPQSHHQLIAMTSNSAGLVSSTGMGQFYPGGDFLSSLTAGQPPNQLPGFSSGDLACGSSNMSLLQGYAALQFNQPFHQTQAQRLYGQFGNREKGTSPEMENTLYTSDQERLIQASNSQSHQQNWQNQSLLGHSGTVSDGTNLWTIGSTTTATTTGKGPSTTNTTSGAPLNPNQWPDLPGFGAP